MGRDSAKVVLVTFCARDGDPYARMASTGEFIDADHHNRLRWGPALRLLADDKSSLYGRVSDLYYFCHPAKAVDPRRVLGRQLSSSRREQDSSLQVSLDCGN